MVLIFNVPIGPAGVSHTKDTMFYGRVYVHPKRAFSKPLYTLFEKWPKVRFILQSKVFQLF